MIKSVFERPFVRAPEKMQGYLDRLNERGYQLERLDELVQVTDEKEKLVRSLKEYDPTLNGDVDNLIEDLALYRQEAEAKKRWTLWDYVTYVPRRVWGAIEAHPYIATGVVLTLAGIAAMYYTGAGTVVVGRLRDWLTSFMTGNAIANAKDAAGEVIGEAKDMAAGAAETAKEGIGKALEGMHVPEMPVPASTIPPGSIPLPKTAPSLEEADMILKGLEMGG